MSEIRSLADQLRSKITRNDAPVANESPPEKKKEKKAAIIPPVIELLRAYDLADHKSMVHIRFENQTAQMLHHLKMATGVEVNKVVAFAVRHFLAEHPELKTIIKQHLQKLEL